jgi:hypothetical protein
MTREPKWCSLFASKMPGSMIPLLLENKLRRDDRPASSVSAFTLFFCGDHEPIMCLSTLQDTHSIGLQISSPDVALTATMRGHVLHIISSDSDSCLRRRRTRTFRKDLGTKHDQSIRTSIVLGREKVHQDGQRRW